MTLPEVLIALSFIDLGVAAYAIYMRKRVWQLQHDNERQKDLAAKALENYQKYRQSLLDTRDHLQLQLEKAEQAWGDAQASSQYNCKENLRLCELIKKERSAHHDLVVRYDNLVRQFNSITKSTGEMPT